MLAHGNFVDGANLGNAFVNGWHLQTTVKHVVCERGHQFRCHFTRHTRSLRTNELSKVAPWSLGCNGGGRGPVLDVVTPGLENLFLSWCIRISRSALRRYDVQRMCGCRGNLVGVDQLPALTRELVVQRFNHRTQEGVRGTLHLVFFGREVEAAQMQEAMQRRIHVYALPVGEHTTELCTLAC
jgi:hypothetical protein